jgi:L-iditol 2-dehydrogenase
MIGLFKTAPGTGNMELREAPAPRPAPGQVLIRVKACGVCGSDLHVRHWDTRLPMKLPVIIGHEFSGEIDELGQGVEGWKIGEAVTCEPTYEACGVCLHCQAGFYNLCPSRRVLGFWTNGAFAELVAVPARRLHRLPPGVCFEEGALSEPLACCVHAVCELTPINPGELVLLSGPGAIGLFCLQLARLAGAKVVVAGTSADRARMKVAALLGADRLVNVQEEDLGEVVAGLSGGVGADVTLECSGSEAAANTGIELVRKRGRYTQVGLFGRPIRIDFEKIAYKEIQVTGSMAQRWSAWRRALQLLGEGKVSLKPMVTDVMPLGRWSEAFDQLDRKEGIKILLRPGA